MCEWARCGGRNRRSHALKQLVETSRGGTSSSGPVCVCAPGCGGYFNFFSVISARYLSLLCGGHQCVWLGVNTQPQNDSNKQMLSCLFHIPNQCGVVTKCQPFSIKLLVLWASRWQMGIKLSKAARHLHWMKSTVLIALSVAQYPCCNMDAHFCRLFFSLSFCKHKVEKRQRKWSAIHHTSAVARSFREHLSTIHHSSLNTTRQKNSHLSNNVNVVIRLW